LKKGKGLDMNSSKTDQEKMTEKAVRLYQYLQHLVKLRTSVVSNIDQYIDIIWLRDIPHEKYCHCAVWNFSKKEDSDPIWVEIKRPVLPKVPKIPEICDKWVDLSTLENYTVEPVLKDKIVKEVDSDDKDDQERVLEYLNLADFPDVQQVWFVYVQSQWKVWAEEYERVKKVQDIYSHLFSMYQQQKALGESYEVIIGLGLLNCKTKGGAKIYRHIISAQTELDFESNKGTIVVKASPEGAKLQFETEMLDPSEQPSVKIQLNLEERLSEIANDIWDKSLIDPVIKSWINSKDPKAVYSDDIYPPQKDNTPDYPVASFGPAIILRKRTKVGIVRFIEKVISQLRESKDVPPAVKVFLSIDKATEEKKISDPLLPPEKEARTHEAPKEIYFPLAFNDEQFRIIREVGNRKGVIVQGPPGTGKSHTIANLISHFLATGKKVLVTSQTARSLKVLKEKIPKQLQPLCVSILGNRQEDFDSLISAVHDITNKYYSRDKENSQKRIAKLESDLYSLKKLRQKITVALRELREKEVYKHTIIDNKFSGTAQSIAQQLKVVEDQYGWISDEIDSKEPVPLSQEQFKKLITLYRKFDEECCKELSLKKIKTSDIFTPEEFVEMVEREQKYRQKEDTIESDIELRMLYDKLKKADAEKRKSLLGALATLEKAKSEACRRPLPWLEKAVLAMLGDQDQPLEDLATVTKKYLQGLKDKALISDDCKVSMPRNVDLFKVKADAEELIRHFNAGQKLGWGVFRPKIYKKIKYLLQNVQVNGRICDNTQSLDLLVNFIDVELSLAKLKEIWKNRIEMQPAMNFSQISIISEQLEALEVVLSIEAPLRLAKEAIRDLDVISEPPWHEKNLINRLISALDATFIIDRMNEIQEKMSEINVVLKSLTTNPDVHPLAQALLQSLEARDWTSWGEAYNKLLELEESKKLLNECTILMRKLETKAPLLVAMICENAHDQIWDRRSSDFEKSWDWLKADAWLREFEEKHDEYKLQRDYEDCENKLKKVTTELISIKAWDHCFNDMTESQRQHLMAWSEAIRRIGKGTGKRAEKHRRDAQENMSKCREAIPAWVMPLYRIAETIRPKPNVFDVVIIDEASQCGPEALFLIYIAKKCIIVGDNQQISPEGVGIKREEVDLLIERFLYDFPIKDSYGVESSLFTHAQIRYGSRVVLREHFRCVPEIIGFSNNLCYIPLGTSLIPLRSYPPKRLEPICVKYIQDGYREGIRQNVINKPEAEALVGKIVDCIKDPTYAGKTMGVISLQGNTQAGYIERLLVENIGPKEMESRNIICGDAYDFQGDERDVIFLSMVAATNERIGPLVRETDKRRFNVAVSRARDQIWLFTSVTVNDLSPADYRYKLLAYCQAPSAPLLSLGDLNIESLLKTAKISDRNNVTAPEPFDSWFEVDVFLKIIERGYKVIPQFKVANVSIDLVIEGFKDRLAVECDGDRWHGPEQYENDQLRQRILERSGWRFWRIRGSTYYRDPEQALDSLWQILEEMDIRSKYQPKEEDVEVSEVIEEQPKELLEEIEEESVREAEPDDDRLAAAFTYAKNRHKHHSEKLDKLKKEDVKKSVINLLHESTQGKDLIADKVLRKLNFTCRGRNRSKLKKKVLRVVTDLGRENLVEEYETDSRIRIRLLKNRPPSLFD